MTSLQRRPPWTSRPLMVGHGSSGFGSGGGVACETACVSDARPEPYGVRAGARTTQRRGRMTAAKRSMLDELGPRWSVADADTNSPARIALAFGRTAPLLLDIGGGTGQATRAWATERPDYNVVGVELHRPGLVRLLKELDRAGPLNVRVIEADATALVDNWPTNSVAGVRVLFPDPWPKRRHVHRRLVDPGFVRRLADILEPGGTLHLATDWPDYADQMRACLATEARLTGVIDVMDEVDEVDEVDGAGDVDGHLAASPAAPTWRSHRPNRPVTPYEARGLAAGRPIADLLARRI